MPRGVLVGSLAAEFAESLLQQLRETGRKEHTAWQPVRCCDEREEGAVEAVPEPPHRNSTQVVDDRF